jgi:hypothetical protein
MPAKEGVQQPPQRLFCAKRAEVSLKLTSGLVAGASLKATVSAEKGATVSWQQIGTGSGGLHGRTTVDGRHTVLVEGSGPGVAETAFELAAAYMGAKR